MVTRKCSLKKAFDRKMKGADGKVLDGLKEIGMVVFVPTAMSSFTMPHSQLIHNRIYDIHMICKLFLPGRFQQHPDCG